MEGGVGRFLDGKISRPFTVCITLSDQSVLIRQDNTLITSWGYPEIFVKEDWVDGIGGSFSVRGNPDASLIIDRKDIFQAIQQKLVRQNRATFLIPAHMGNIALLTLLAGIACVVLFPLVNHLAGWATYLVPHRLENKLGDIAKAEMADEYTPCTDDVANAYMQKIMGRLVAAASVKDLHPEIQFYKTSTQNAFTLPGRTMAVLTGFLHHSRNENEMAAVMAHEMGHMVHRDPLEAFIESQGLGVVMSLIGSSGSYGDVAKAVSFMQAMRYSRDKEYAADAYGASLLMKAGYSPTGLSDFLDRMDKEDRSSLGVLVKQFEFLSTHPDTTERIRRVKAMGGASNYKASLSGAEFLRLKEACQK